MDIVIIPGDGIGPETMQVSVELLQKANAAFGLGLNLSHEIAGHDSLRQHGATVTQGLLDKVKAADGLLLGPMATYDFKDEESLTITKNGSEQKEPPTLSALIALDSDLKTQLHRVLVDLKTKLGKKIGKTKLTFDKGGEKIFISLSYLSK